MQIPFLVLFNLALVTEDNTSLLPVNLIELNQSLMNSEWNWLDQPPKDKRMLVGKCAFVKDHSYKCVEKTEVKGSGNWGIDYAEILGDKLIILALTPYFASQEKKEFILISASESQLIFYQRKEPTLKVYLEKTH